MSSLKKMFGWQKLNNFNIITKHYFRPLLLRAVPAFLERCRPAGIVLDEKSFSEGWYAFKRNTLQKLCLAVRGVVLSDRLSRDTLLTEEIVRSFCTTRLFNLSDFREIFNDIPGRFLTLESRSVMFPHGSVGKNYSRVGCVDHQLYMGG